MPPEWERARPRIGSRWRAWLGAPRGGAWRRDWLAFVSVLAVAALARFVFLRSSPGWHIDECVFVGQAWNLIHGRFQWDAVAHTFLPRLPLWHLTIGPLLVSFGKDVLWVRAVAASSGVATALLLLAIGRGMGSARAGWIAATLFALSPYCAAMNRWGFSYNLSSVLGAANLALLLAYAGAPARVGMLWAAALAAGLGMVSEPIAAPRLALTAGAAWMLGGKRKAAVAAAIALAPLAGYAAFMLVFHAALFLEDARLNFFSGRVAGASDWFSLIRAFGLFLGHTHGVGALGLIGLLFLPGGARRRIIWAAFALDLALALKLSGTDTSRLFRMGIALAPPLFLGAGFLLDTAWARAGAGGRGGAIWTARAPALVAALIIALMAFRLGDEIRRQFREIAGETGKSCVFDIEAADAAGKWLRGRLLPGDLVMATHLEWLADCRTASPMLANLAEGGEGNPIYPKALRRRFVYPCRLSDVRFAIEHEASPAMEAFFQYRSIGETIRAWPLAWSRGSIRIHRNPRLAE